LTSSLVAPLFRAPFVRFKGYGVSRTLQMSADLFIVAAWDEGGNHHETRLHFIEDFKE
jgi:hypothetical protein